MGEHAPVPHLGDNALERHSLGLEKRVEAHRAEPDRALAHRRVARPLHPLRRAVDEVLQHVVEEAHDVFDEQRVVTPLVPALEVDRAQAAHRRALPAVMVEASGQGDLRAQVRGLDLEPGQLVVLGAGVVHLVGKDEIGLAGLDPGGQDAYPQIARRNLAHHRLVLGR